MVFFVNHLRKKNLKHEKAVVVAPDAGIAKSAARLARLLGLSVAVGSKQRFSDTNVKISRTIRKQVKGFECAIIYDDEISTGSSVVALSKILLKSTIRRICVVTTHGLFTGPAIENLKSIPQIEEIIVTDTVPTPSAETLSNLTVLSVADTFGAAIYKNYHHESIGTLFTFWEEDEEDL